MPKRIITVQDRQSVWDIAIREYGSVEGVFRLLADNPELDGVDAELSAGQQLRIERPAVDEDVVRYYLEGGYYPVTEYVVEQEDDSCSEAPNALQFTIAAFNDFGVIDFFVSSSHVAYKAPGAPRIVVPTDGGFLQLEAPAVGEHCIYPCDADGVATGAFVSNMNLSGLTLSAWTCTEVAFLCESIFIYDCTFTVSLAVLNLYAVEIAGLVGIDAPHPIQVLAPNCTVFEFDNATPNTDALSLSDSMPNCTTLSLINLALPVDLVDAAINALSASNADGLVAVLGGTSDSPGAASAARRVELDAAGWGQFYN